MDPVERLVASVGNSPLPLARWLSVLGPRHLVLMSSSDTRAVAERVAQEYRRRRPDAEVSHFEVPPDVPFEIYSAILEALGKEPASILYGGGTTPMNVMLNQWRLKNPPLEDAPPEHAYYAAAKSGSLHREDGHVVAHDSASSQLSIESIISLHLDPQEHRLEFGRPEVSALAARPNDAERTFLGKAAELILARPDAATTMDDLKAVHRRLGSTLRPTVREYLYGLCQRQDPGLLFELAAAAFISAIKQSAGLPADEFQLNVNVRNLNRESEMELDVIYRRDEVLTAVSCGVVPLVADARRKYFEVKDRATSIGGSEARALTVVHARETARLSDREVRNKAAGIRSRLKLTSRLGERDRNALVLGRELFGAEPVRRIKDPQSMLGTPDEHIYRWVVGTRARGASQ